MPARPATGDLRDQLRALLANYNHVVLGAPPEVNKVIITSAKDHAPREVTVSRDVTVPTVRIGPHHVVKASLRGVGGRRTTVELMLDTGASTVVLPWSKMKVLGYRAESLREQRSKTANGVVVGRAARLESVQVAGAAARDVEVLFLPDEGLSNALLGMSFLRRFSFTVDDAGSRLVLTER